MTRTKLTTRRAITLSTLFSLALAACASSAEEPPKENSSWTGNLKNVGVQWTAAPGIELTTGTAVALRAYVESYDIVQFSGQMSQAYPGFTNAVLPNTPKGPGVDRAERDRMPSTDVADSWDLVGNMRFRVQSLTPTGDSVTAVVCSYRYALGREQPDDEYVPLNKSAGPPETRGVAALRVTLRPPPNGSASVLPPQSGPEREPSVDVFGGWKVTGRLSSPGGPIIADSWPEFQQAEDQCVVDAPDSIAQRQAWGSGTLASDYQILPPSPGWPQPSQ